MKSRSCKNKGKRLQNEVMTKIIAELELAPEDVRSVPTGVPGIDIWLSEMARSKFPFACECKNQQSISIWKCLEQAESNGTKDLFPLLIFSRNRSKTYAVLDFDLFLCFIKQGFDFQNLKKNLGAQNASDEIKMSEEEYLKLMKEGKV